MERLKAWVRMVFGFSRTETNAFIILIPLLVIILFSEPVYRWWWASEVSDSTSDQLKLDSLIAQLDWSADDSVKTRPIPAAIKFEYFDPNTLTEKTFVQYGLSGFIAQRIERFRKKGGIFRTKEDLLKIYGMDSMWFKAAAQWIVIAPQLKKPKETWTVREKVKEEITDINLADSIQLLKVYGVGPALSKRILKFRNGLGGFVSMDQLKDVYGLDSATIREMSKKFFVSESFQPQKINLNTAVLQDLTRNPYIRRREAQAIVSFRMQHGMFSSFDALKQIQLLTPEWIEKVRPYLTLE